MWPETVLLSSYIACNESCEVQVTGKATQQKSLSPADAERLIGHMVAEGYLDLELGYTAYSTNAYLKCGRMAPRLLEGMNVGKPLWLSYFTLETFCVVLYVTK